MKPCIIILNRVIGRFEAYNEDARQPYIFSSNWTFSDVSHFLKQIGYIHVPLNSYLGGAIFDKLPLNVQMQQTTKS